MYTCHDPRHDLVWLGHASLPDLPTSKDAMLRLDDLDTHGFEVPIFEGAAETLARTGLIVVEVYNFKISPEALRFHELCAYLEGKGFRCVDILDVMHRPCDGALWQMDLIFARADRPEFANNEYR